MVGGGAKAADGGRGRFLGPAGAERGPIADRVPANQGQGLGRAGSKTTPIRITTQTNTPPSTLSHQHLTSQLITSHRPSATTHTRSISSRFHLDCVPTCSTAPPSPPASLISEPDYSSKCAHPPRSSPSLRSYWQPCHLRSAQILRMRTTRRVSGREMLGGRSSGTAGAFSGLAHPGA